MTPEPKLFIDNIPVSYVELAQDGFDHSFIKVNKVIPGREARINLKGTESGEGVFLWGQPSGWSDMFRRGYRVGTLESPPFELGTDPLHVYDLEAFKGDSGSAIFNYSGEVVGIISMRYSMVYPATKHPHLMQATFTFSYPFEFSKEQWKAINEQ